MQADDGNDDGVTAELTDFGIGFPEVRSLCGVDITGWAASLPSDFSGRTCLLWKKQPARGGKCNERAHMW